MNVKVWLKKRGRQITIEINGHKIKNIDLNKAIWSYKYNDLVLDKIKQACIKGNKHSREVWAEYDEAVAEMDSFNIDEDMIEAQKLELEQGKRNKSIEQLLNEIKDDNIKSQVEELLERYKDIYKEDFQLIGEGESSTVFSIGDKVIKFGVNPHLEDVPLTLNAYEKIPYNKFYAVRVLDRLNLENISDDDVQYVYNSLRDMGYVWADIKNDNIGRVPNMPSEEDGLRIIDDIDIFSEKEISRRFPTVLQFLSTRGIREMIHEIEYQRLKNPDFDTNNLGQYFDDYKYSQDTQILVSIYELELNKYDEEKKKNKAKQYRSEIADMTKYSETEHGESKYDGTNKSSRTDKQRD